MRCFHEIFSKKAWEWILIISTLVQAWHEKFSLAKKIFRQFSSLVKDVTLLSRNFCQKCVRLNCSNFHTVCDSKQCYGNWKLLSSISWKVFGYCKIKSFLNFPKKSFLEHSDIVVQLISWNFFQRSRVRVNLFTWKIWWISFSRVLI